MKLVVVLMLILYLQIDDFVVFPVSWGIAELGRLFYLIISVSFGRLDRVIDFLVVRTTKISVITFQFVVSRVVAIKRQGCDLVGEPITAD